MSDELDHGWATNPVADVSPRDSLSRGVHEATKAFHRLFGASFDPASQPVHKGTFATIVDSYRERFGSDHFVDVASRVFPLSANRRDDVLGRIVRLSAFQSQVVDGIEDAARSLWATTDGLETRKDRLNMIRFEAHWKEPFQSLTSAVVPVLFEQAVFGFEWREVRTHGTGDLLVQRLMIRGVSGETDPFFVDLMDMSGAPQVEEGVPEVPGALRHTFEAFVRREQKVQEPHLRAKNAPNN